MNTLDLQETIIVLWLKSINITEKKNILNNYQIPPVHKLVDIF